MTRKSQERLAPFLEKLYALSPRARIQQDPIAIPHRYKDPVEIELTAWLTTSFAYGRAPFFNQTVDKILSLSNDAKSFHQYLRTLNLEKERHRFDSIYYRFNRSEDILCLVYIMSQIVLQYGGIKQLFLSCYKGEDGDIGPTLSRLIEKILAIDTKPVYGGTKKPPGSLQFFPSPDQNSACKRWNLYLRWMVRPNDGVDFGLWKEIPPSKLIIPLDTHIARIGRYLGLTSRKSADWATAKEITQNLAGIDPVDPLKYDFSLCHLGISGACPILPNAEKCRACLLLPACKRGMQGLNRSCILCRQGGHTMDYTMTQVRSVLRNYEVIFAKKKENHSKEGVSTERVHADDAHISEQGFAKLMALEQAKMKQNADKKYP